MSRRASGIASSRPIAVDRWCAPCGWRCWRLRWPPRPVCLSPVSLQLAASCAEVAVDRGPYSGQPERLGLDATTPTRSVEPGHTKCRLIGTAAENALGLSQPAPGRTRAASPTCTRPVCSVRFPVPRATRNVANARSRPSRVANASRIRVIGSGCAAGPPSRKKPSRLSDRLGRRRHTTACRNTTNLQIDSVRASGNHGLTTTRQKQTYGWRANQPGSLPIRARPSSE
jgi:hypothetical protein